jgi:hypothetical protein
MAIIKEMTFVVKPLNNATLVQKEYKKIPFPLPQPASKACWVLLSRRRGGKTVMLTNLLALYSKIPGMMCVVYSPSAFLDPNWKACSKMKNVMFSDRCDNEILQNLMDVQKARYMEDKNNQLLLILDDFGNAFRSKSMRQMLDVIWTTARHCGCGTIASIQSLTMMSSTQITNTSQWCIWACENRMLKKITTELSTAQMEPKQLEALIKDVTKTPYNFVYIDYTQAKEEDVFHRNFE